jgi:NADH-quinone oxidoreductase subunit J
MEPVATTFFFYFFAAVAIVSAVVVITRRNPVHSAVALIFTLLAVAGFYLMLYAPFVAGVQIIVYVGGIVVLFLFVIMLVNLERAMREEQFNRQWHVALLIAAALGGLIVYLYARGRTGLMASLPMLPEQQNTQDIGTLLYGGYLLPFEIASLLLLVAMVGAVVMAKKRI